MKLERYQLKSDSDLMSFEFISDGPKGKIVKMVQYTEMEGLDAYNIGFGDKNNETGTYDDNIVTDNKDITKVLATVAATVESFTIKYPEKWVFITGSSKARTRLYRMAIAHYFQELEKDFYILGLLTNKWVEFEKDKKYTSFIIKRK